MAWWLLFAVILYVLCALLLVAEVFVPSGGLLTVCAIACLAAGVLIFFQQGVQTGWMGVVAALVLVPLTLVIAYRIFPKTRFGKSVTLNPPTRTAGDAVPDTSELAKMLGAEGRVITPLRPVGTCDFGGKRIECVAEEGFVEKGKKVKVISLESTQLTVRIVGDQEA